MAWLDTSITTYWMPASTISAKYFCTRKDSGVVLTAGMCLSPMMASMVPIRPVGFPAFSRMPRIM